MTETALSTSIDRRPRLRFGIDNLDMLLDPPRNDRRYMPGIDPKGGATTLSLMGHEGSGKALFALHLAATYAGDLCAESGGSPAGASNIPARVVVLSRETRYAKAKEAWDSFSLGDWPRQHPFPNDKCIPAGAPSGTPLNLVDVRLREQAGNQATDAAAVLRGSASAGQVLYVDQLTDSLGDDIGFALRLIALLPECNCGPKHLVVLDSLDSYLATQRGGEGLSIESRKQQMVGQLIRCCRDKAHLVMTSISEIPGGIENIVVLRKHAGTNSRTVEVVKVSAHAPVRGEHQYVLRNGVGSQTGKDDGDLNTLCANPDDPPWPLKTPNLNPNRSYLHVFHSLGFRERMRSEEKNDSDPGDDQSKGTSCPFGLRGVDELLSTASPGDGSIARYGLVGIVGDDGTYKSRLGRAFIAQALKDERSVVYLSTQDLRYPPITDVLRRHPLRAADFTDERIRKQLVYRRLPLHNVTSAMFMHICDQCVKEATRRNGQRGRGEECSPVLVLDDLAVVFDLYPQIRSDPQFLDYFMFWLRDNGIAACVIASYVQATETRSCVADLLSQRVDTRIRLWRQAFYGADRVAFEVLPSPGDRRGTRIRELISLPSTEPAQRHAGDEALLADPHFELYRMDVDRPNETKPVALEIRLVGGGAAEPGEDRTTLDTEYVTRVRAVIRRVFSERRTRVSMEDIRKYELARVGAQLRGDAVVDRTTVVQLDEYWAARTESASSGGGGLGTGLLPLNAYLEENPDGGTANERFAKRFFRTFPRKDAFDDEYIQPLLTPTVDRVPYVWDFGFLLVRNNVYDGCRWKEFVDSLRSGESGRQPGGEDLATWRKLLEVCRRPDGTTAFGFDLQNGEGFSCLFLEIWLSLIADKDASFTQRVGQRRVGSSPLAEGVRVSDLLSKHRAEFVTSMWLVAHIVTAKMLEGHQSGFTATPVDKTALVSRQWYSTAKTFAGVEIGELHPLRLPGRFSTRGDWDLAIAGTSQSSLLGKMALDLLSSERGNIARLRHGVGLPVRKLFPAGLDVKGDLLTYLRDKRGTTLSLERFLVKGRKYAPEEREIGWLYRSSIVGYAGVSRVLQVTAAHFLREYLRLRGSNHIEAGFKLVWGFDYPGAEKMAVPERVDVVENKKGRSFLRGFIKHLDQSVRHVEGIAARGDSECGERVDSEVGDGFQL